MPITRRLRGNIIAVGLAFLLSIAVYSGVTNYTNLATDIRGATGVDATILTDLVVKVEESNLVITTGKDIPEVETISILFVYDGESVNRSNDGVQSSYDRAVSEGEKGEATVVVTLGGKTLPKGSEVMKASIVGSPYDIVPADVVATFTDGSTSTLALTLP